MDRLRNDILIAVAEITQLSERFKHTFSGAADLIRSHPAAVQVLSGEVPATMEDMRQMGSIVFEALGLTLEDIQAATKLGVDTTDHEAAIDEYERAVVEFTRVMRSEPRPSEAWIAAEVKRLHYLISCLGVDPGTSSTPFPLQ